MADTFDIAVVGAGAVGLSAAWQLARRYPDARILVLDKEAGVAHHQTGRNSGVIHSGLYYRPGSARARNCIEGRELLVAFCRAHDVTHEVCGKVVVAVTEDELPRLDKIYETGLQNGLDQIRVIDQQTLREHEPHCAGIRAIHVPYTGIVDYRMLCERLLQLTLAFPHNRAVFGAEVRGLARRNGSYTLHTTQGDFQARYLVSCAGLHSDRLARMEGIPLPARIVGFRGDYWDLAPHARHKVRNLIYPVPNPAFPFLGVHFTRMVPSAVHPDGGVECGPSAVFTFKREGYGKTDFSWRDSASALGYGGTWRLFGKHWRFGLREQLRAFSKTRFLNDVRRLIPSLEPHDLVPGRSGVRAMALGPNGEMLDDFVIAQQDSSIHVLNAPSPAATACLAIGRDIADMADRQFALVAAPAAQPNSVQP